MSLRLNAVAVLETPFTHVCVFVLQFCRSILTFSQHFPWSVVIVNVRADIIFVNLYVKYCKSGIIREEDKLANLKISGKLLLQAPIALLSSKLIIREF